MAFTTENMVEFQEREESARLEQLIPAGKYNWEIEVAEVTEINGLPISSLTLEYYYTYGSVLSAYLDCDHAMQIMNKVSAYAPNDEIIQGIVQENKNICQTTK